MLQPSFSDNNKEEGFFLDETERSATLRTQNNVDQSGKKKIYNNFATLKKVHNIIDMITSLQPFYYYT